MASYVFFHAHPGNEALLTGGAIASLVAAGDRVVVVVGGDGTVDEVPTGGPPRLHDLDRSAEVLGVSRLVYLGYAATGPRREVLPHPTDRPRFALADVDEIAAKLAQVLRDENAYALIHYDVQGYRQDPDHDQVHRVGVRAAELAGTERVFEVTGAPADRMRGGLVGLPSADGVRHPMREPGTDGFVHELDVRAHLGIKLEAMAHHSSRVADSPGLARMVHHLAPLAAWPLSRSLGREWYIERSPSRAYAGGQGPTDPNRLVG